MTVWVLGWLDGISAEFGKFWFRLMGGVFQLFEIPCPKFPPCCFPFFSVPLPLGLSERAGKSVGQRGELGVFCLVGLGTWLSVVGGDDGGGVELE